VNAPALRAVRDRNPLRRRNRLPGPAPGPGPCPAACRGAVTAEFAVALPAVLLVLGLLLAGSAAGLTQLRLEEAARAGARALARGEDHAAVLAIVRQLAGESANAAVAADGGWLSITVSGSVRGTVGPLVPWTLSARAWARSESGDAPAAALPVTPRIPSPVPVGQPQQKQPVPHTLRDLWAPSAPLTPARRAA